MTYEKAKNDIEALKSMLNKENKKPGFRGETTSAKAYKMLIENNIDFEQVKNAHNLDDKMLADYCKWWLNNIKRKEKRQKNGKAVSKTVSKTESTKKETKKIPVIKQNLDFETKVDSNNPLNVYIPKDGNYIPRVMINTKKGKITDEDIMLKAYMQRHFILIEGETGTGKTHLVRHLAGKLKIPYMRLNLNGATTPEDLIGQFIPNNKENSNSKYVWQDGILTTFVKNGGVVVLDEINMASADILALLHPLLDHERQLVLTQKDGEKIEAHKDFWLVATQNPDYEGTKPLNLALRSRFRVITLEYNEAVEKKLQIPQYFMNCALSLRKSDEIITPVSTRELKMFREDFSIYGKEVAEQFFIDKFEEHEKNVVREIIELNH